ncbi:MAG: hypothetical protein V1882_02600 [Candidatus Omnitrophota bacterium]
MAGTIKEKYEKIRVLYYETLNQTAVPVVKEKDGAIITSVINTIFYLRAMA